MATKNQSPCLTCIRVKDPSNCENKTCKLWKAWFIRTWEAMRDRCGVGEENGK